jgi:hypothetical protein
MLRIKHLIEEGKELDVIRDLFREYEKELDEDICFQSFDEELKKPVKKITDHHQETCYWHIGKTDSRLYCINKNERCGGL